MYEWENLGIPFAVAFIDIDKFKLFNDTYGHDVGDEVLKMTAKTLTTALRGADSVGRWGGEEFVAVLSAVDQAGLQNVCEKMRMLVEKSALRHEDQTLQVTVSIGAALVKKGETHDELIKRADELLYQSKEQGRNRVTIDKCDDFIVS
jgi:diguanylate cyclase (GGDEF)-like protein